MQCPFLKETRVRWCRTAGIREPIPESQSDDAACRFLDERFRTCRWVSPEARQSAPPCPHLEHELVQYCEAAPLTRYVPFSEPLLTRCGSSAHRYCDFYLDILRAARPPFADHEFAAPADLYYTRNHWWIDAQDDEMCHIGMDAFLVRLLGAAERAGIRTPRGMECPCVPFGGVRLPRDGLYGFLPGADPDRGSQSASPPGTAADPAGAVFGGMAVPGAHQRGTTGRAEGAASDRRRGETADGGRRAAGERNAAIAAGGKRRAGHGGRRLVRAGAAGLLEAEDALRMFHEVGSLAAGQRR